MEWEKVLTIVCSVFHPSAIEFCAASSIVDFAFYKDDLDRKTANFRGEKYRFTAYRKIGGQFAPRVLPSPLTRPQT